METKRISRSSPGLGGDGERSTAEHYEGEWDCDALPTPIVIYLAAETSWPASASLWDSHFSCCSTILAIFVA